MSDSSGGNDVGEASNNNHDRVDGYIVSTNSMEWMFDEEMLIDEAMDVNGANEEWIAKNQGNDPPNEEPVSQNNQVNLI